MSTRRASTTRSSSRSAEQPLHVTNGESVVGTLRATSLGGDTLSWHDVLCEGPVPALPQEDLLPIRAAFLAEHGWGTRAELGRVLEQRDRRFADALAAGRRIVLWFEHDLFDQLQLLQVLAQAHEAGFDPARLELIGVGSFEGKPDFAGLGELDPVELETLWPLRRPVRTHQVDLAVAAWSAVRAPAPTAIERFLEADVSALPFLAPALRRLLEQLPDSTTGLSRSERQLLELAANRPRTSAELFVDSQRLEEAPFEGDTWVWQRLATLGRGDPPLVTSTDDGAVAITETGREVLAGRLDATEVLGIDRWVGGTHLRSGELWRWDRMRQRVESPPAG